MTMLRMLRAGVLATAVITLCACSNPRTNPPANNTPAANAPDHTGPKQRPAVSLRPSHNVGDRYRTTRKLKVEETTETERYLTESEEVTLTEVLRVDDAGRLMDVRRSWENSRTRLTRGYGKGEDAKGDLDGCTLELTRHMNGVGVKLLSGDAPIRGANFLIEGFDTGLLPLDPVRENDYWVLEGSRLAGLNAIIKAMDFKIEKNKLTCQLADVTAANTRISLDWRISGQWQKAPSVLEFSGELVFDRAQRMITSFRLKGGRQGGGLNARQVEINITRKPVNGWLDLER